MRFFALLTGIGYLVGLILLACFPGPTLTPWFGGLFTVGQLGVIAALFELKGVVGLRRGARRVGAVLTALGATAYGANYVFGYWLGWPTRPLLPLGAVTTAVGMTVLGIALLRAPLTGWRRFAPLAVGLYPFLVMFPLLVVTGHPSLLAIAGWGFPWLALGIALQRRAA